MTAPAFTALGKEVLRDGQHYADAVTSADAEIIARALGVPEMLDRRADAAPHARSFARMARIVADHIRMETK